MPIYPSYAGDVAREAELLEPAGGAQVRLRFNGSFEGKSVSWEATFTTLANWQVEHPSDGPGRNFIEIGEETTHGIALTVGLNVPCIDIPTIRKAIMMVRQYKRLARGRHEFGETPSPAGD
jgi:hypothetical protein